MSSVGRYLRSLDPQLPRSVWILQAGGLANSFGNGIVLPFLIIYLHDVRGISLGTSGLVLAVYSGIGIVAGPVAGTVIDHIGARAMLVVSLVLLAVGYGLFPLVRTPWEAFVLALVAGTGNGSFWPSHSSLLAWLAPSERLHVAFSQQRVTNNLGIGIGGLVGGLIATTSDPASFTTLFLLDAATFLVFIGILHFVPAGAPVHGPGHAPGTYREVFRRHRTFITVIALNTGFVAFGFAMIDVMPVYVKNDAAVSERAIGLIFLVLTLTIVIAQLPIAKALEGRRRMHALALMGVLWAVCWVTVYIAGSTLEATAAALLVAAGVVVFGLGECLHGAVQGPLVADLAPPQLLGRFMALSSLSWQAGLAVGPAVAGFVLARSPAALWLGDACLILAMSGAALVLDRSLPAGVRRTPRTAAHGALAGAG